MRILSLNRTNLFISSILIILTGILLPTGCTDLNDSISNSIPEKVTYEQQVKPILERSCVRCHNTEIKNYNVDLSNYTSITELPQITKGDPTSRLLDDILEPKKGIMYQYLSNPSEYDIIFQWIVEDSLAEF